MSGIQVRIPSDGGNPRDPARIQQIGENAFHVDPYHEPWLGLRHALARVEFCLDNEGRDEEEITLEIDYDPDDTQDGSPRSDIEGRDHLYIRNRDRWWRVDGHVEGCILKTRFAIPSGETLVCLSPAFNYEDYLRFIESLPETPYLSKSVWMHSAAGREVWMLKVTDPKVEDAEKINMLIDCRKHAYETFSSFGIQGILSFLLSGHPAANLDRIIYTIVPMMNPDGVAEGWMYEPPKDDPVFAALGRLDSEELLPDVVVTMHNWVHRRFEDIRYGHLDDRGEQLVEAWHTFKGFMPAETEYGRAYVVDEDGKGCYRPRPGAKPGERVRHGWCCEIPWFGRDDIDPVQRARETGVKFINAVVQTELRLLGVQGAALVEPYETVYLSGLEWSEAGPRRPNFPPRTPRRDRAQNGTLMRLQNVSYDRGISLTPSMRILYELPDSCDSFEAMIGLDDGSCYPDDPIRIDFAVLVDGQEAWRSDSVGPGVRQKVCVPLSGAKTLELRSLAQARDGADDLESRLKIFERLSANWADAKLIKGTPILHVLADAGIQI